MAVGTAGGMPTQFESVVVSITDSLNGVLTTAAPFNQSTAHEMDLGHDDTAAIAQGMAAVGAGGRWSSLPDVSYPHANPEGAKPHRAGHRFVHHGFSGRGHLSGPRPQPGARSNQGAAHIHDLTFLVDARIDATLPWQVVNDTGTTAKAAMYRPIAQKSGVSSNPLAPGWFQGPNSGGGYQRGGRDHGRLGGDVRARDGNSALGGTEGGLSLPGQRVHSNGGVDGRELLRRGYGADAFHRCPRAQGKAQAEWFAGSGPQNLATAISSGTCPTSITLANSINPVPGYESNVAPFGMVQIDGEQFTYFGKSIAANPTPANTLYGVQCAQNGTTRAAHVAWATVVPLNNFKPSYPWPVTPTLNRVTPRPAGRRDFSRAGTWATRRSPSRWPPASARARAQPVRGAPTPRSRICRSFRGLTRSTARTGAEVNHTAMIYMVSPSYATTFANLYTLYLFYGIAIGPPSIENGNYGSAQPTADGTHWDGITIYAANPVNIPLGNQNSFSNFNVYSQEGTTGVSRWARIPACTSPRCRMTRRGAISTLSLDHFKNMYCEPEGGPHAVQMPEWEWDTYNSEMEDQHMGGGGEVYIGGAQQHWFGGNFNNAITRRPSIGARAIPRIM